MEVNLERHSDLRETFLSVDIGRIVNDLEVLPNVGNVSEQSVIFLDEVQAVPAAITALRYFYEDRPELPVVAAGSLFDTVLADQKLSMPVGRVEYLHMGPMTFTEFLRAQGNERLVQTIQEFDLTQEISTFRHNRLLSHLRTFFFVGGMPEAVAAYVSSNRLSDAQRIHSSIVDSYRDDLPKYVGSSRIQRVENILFSAARTVGRKVKYVNFARDVPARETRRELELLCSAKLVSRVFHSHCNGIPLQAELDPNAYKLLFLDIGLMTTICGLDQSSFDQRRDEDLVNQGALAEQLIGQHLQAAASENIANHLTYWIRARRSQSAEVDYVVSHAKRIVPIEVKAGASGSLKSLHQFVAEKHSRIAVRFDLNPPSVQRIQTRVRVGSQPTGVDYWLISLPLYLVESLPSVLKHAIGNETFLRRVSCN